jgi:YesN/AraC family two-component response regulator
MPEMDGLTLCKLLKSNDKTCHIPVILLTAKTSMEQRIEGLEMGADSYIPKPFNLKHLETRIDKLIQLRAALKTKFAKNPEEEGDVKMISSDEKLFRKFNEKLKEQISNPDLSVESISQELGLSRVHLNRRLKLLINESPSTYIRTYRLKQAAWLLASKKMSIAEVAYAVGFSSHAYFSNIFKEQFGMSPTEYMEVNE